MQRRMDEYDGAAMIETFEYRIDGLIAQEPFAVACEQAGALQPDLVECIGDLGGRRRDVPHRHNPKAAETSRPAL